MAESVNEVVVPPITPAQAQELIAKGDAVLLDVREAAEVQESGKAAGAVHVPRGLLEFAADPKSPQHDTRLDTGKPVIVYCAAGGRAALAGQALKELGYAEVYNLGGFKDWADAGGAIDA
jgi:rhodanese-related sulfurtransferase